MPLTVVVYLLTTPRMFSRLTSTLETVLMPPWALAAEMEESPTATRPRYEVAVATPVREPEELVAAMGSATLAYTSPVGRSERPPQLQSRAEDESRMRSFFMIGFQLIGLAGLPLWEVSCGVMQPRMPKREGLRWWITNLESANNQKY